MGAASSTPRTASHGSTGSGIPAAFARRASGACVVFGVFGGFDESQAGGEFGIHVAPSVVGMDTDAGS
ncbi:hypothetical protein D7319_29185 [Streptomyces radicis]|uniref:Uncharacterized protein n=1 Tax=Streptomyces radicis TaxID=1750517 RepID=A0A3A9W4T9_9ACTN|nr:hypothetical protein D7319_29185 [Streptomyces radicis]RKN14782.1 hypothetical protein D7318_28945 [Streptomyces radicis]